LSKETVFFNFYVYSILFLRSLIGYESLHQILSQSENQSTCIHFSAFGAKKNVQEFVLSSGWFIGIFASTTIGNSNYWFWFYDAQLKTAL